jgi:hypothetical protein
VEQRTEKLDLHTHTTWSSGFSQPVELVRLASKEEVSTLAITDHHALGGYREAQPAAERLHMCLIPAIELDCRSEDRRVDLLGYWIDPEYAQLQEFLRQYRGSVGWMMRDRAFLGAVFGAHGIAYNEAAFHEFAGTDEPTYPMLVEYLVAAGWGRSLGQVFGSLKQLSLSGSLPRIKRTDPPVELASQVLRAAGGVVVLAHPALIRDDDVVRHIAASGHVDAIESPYTSYWTGGDDKNAAYARLAGEFGLATSGGSDFHAYPHTDATLGVELPVDVLTALRARRRA